ncbi:hypothetical protein NP233_g6558 [Leucocoprinus birnbaumii]|uniref:Cytochrome P450 n=1 Tax=Leucocoprinus birnbaumii TaxID=56174 RepID=A0AAD5VQY8_9AGAR|nr:hypothetical protein NP233_g6558 [Leucocoprinus birnbaumii]
MPIITSKDALFLLLCAIVHLVYRNQQKRRLLPLPPGPRRWPIVKNTFAVPLTNAHVHYQELGKKFGSKILFLEALGRPMLIVNDLDMARDLLEKRSAFYSSRPSMTMITDIVKIREWFSFMPYGDYWRVHRRMFQQHFSEKHLPYIEERAVGLIRKGLLANLLEFPDGVTEIIRKCVYSIRLEPMGYPIQRQNDPLVNLAEETFGVMSIIASPGKYFVNIVPALQHIPDWMPGAGFKEVAKEVRRNVDKLIAEPFEATMQMMTDGTAPPCFVTETLERLKSNKDYEVQAVYAKQTAAMIFGAVSETTVTGLKSFILAMLTHPDAMRKAQQELDDVIGTDRLVDSSDIPHLPYLSAIIKETLRWNPITPMCAPHQTTEEDVYMGYYIPKGCIVFANTYAILHDEEVFPGPEEFQPERFLKDGKIRDDILDPEFVATFGFGRRICPGARIARPLLYLVAASLLHLFDIVPALDRDGNPIKVIPQFKQAAIISEPLPFQCKMIPRKGRDVEGLLKGYIGTDPI